MFNYIENFPSHTTPNKIVGYGQLSYKI